MQNCELKKFSVFRDNFCFSKGHVERLPPLPHRHSGFCSVPAMDFLAEFFGGRFSVAFTVLTAEKHTPKIRRKIRWKNSAKSCHFSVRFSVRFSVCFSVRFSVSNFLPQNRKIRAESVLQERPLKNLKRKYEKEKSNHGPSFLPGKTQTMVRVNCPNGDGGGSCVDDRN